LTGKDIVIKNQNFEAKILSSLRIEKLRPAQNLALEAQYLKSRANLIVSSPTNSGKSLVGFLPLLQAIQKDKIGILIVPMRAIAQEKYDEYSNQAISLSKIIGKQFAVRISTGDYRLENEFYQSPPADGELVIVTPERLEALMRNPDNQEWFEKVGAVCLDEAHMIADRRRGQTQEFLITSFLSMPNPPRIILLSATVGDTTAAERWLRPCETIKVTERTPPLNKHIIQLQESEVAEDIILAWTKEVIDQAPDTQILIFVYQTRSAEKLSRIINKAIPGDLAGYYHSKTSSAHRSQVKTDFASNKLRVVVTTTSLAMGINLPTTHVLVRDLSFPGAENPGISDILQMMGRAGRGDTEGHAYALLKPSDSWTFEDLKHQLETEPVPNLKSSFDYVENDWRGQSPDEPMRVATLIGSLLARKGESGYSEDDLATFLGNSFGGSHLADQLSTALKWLEDRKIAHCEDDLWRLTRLGKNAVEAVLPLDFAARVANLFRKLLSYDSTDRVLDQWSPLDTLFLIQVLYESKPSLRRFSESSAVMVDDWFEQDIERESCLYTRWIRGKEGYSEAETLRNTIDLQWRLEQPRKNFYIALFHAIVLLERSRGRQIQILEKRFGIKNLDGVEEKWRDSSLWLLSGLTKILEIKSFYYYLRENRQASDERVQRVKEILTKIRHQIYDLQEQIKYCSPLGPVLLEFRRIGNVGVGDRTIQVLEQNGVTDLKLLLQQTDESLLSFGIRKPQRKAILRFIKRRRI
jgi:helicase